MTSSFNTQLMLRLDEVTRTPNQKTCTEYFAGIGLVRLGLERAGWETVFANDWSPEKLEMYSAYFKESKHQYALKDVFELCPCEIQFSLFASASFPCIDLSLAGNLDGIAGQYSSAFWGFVNVLKNQKSKPLLVMLENVAGWLTSNKGQDFRVTIEALNQVGYACDVLAIDAARFVPQSRPRVFVIGVRADAPSHDISAFLKRDASLKTKALCRAVESNTDLVWRFLDVPPLPQRSSLTLKDIVERMLESDIRWWEQSEVDRHVNMMSAINSAYLDELKQQPKYSYRTVYRRIRAGHQRAEIRKDDIAGCLRTAKGGSSRQILVRAGKGGVRMRLLTPREYARLQGVPDDYPLPTRANQALNGFGDAVCVPVITWIGQSVLNPLLDCESIAPLLKLHS